MTAPVAPRTNPPLPTVVVTPSAGAGMMTASVPAYGPSIAKPGWATFVPVTTVMPDGWPGSAATVPVAWTKAPSATVGADAVSRLARSRRRFSDAEVRVVATAA